MQLGEAKRASNLFLRPLLLLIHGLCSVCVSCVSFIQEKWGTKKKRKDNRKEMHQFVLCYDEDDVQWVRTLLRTNLYAKRSQEDQESDPYLPAISSP